MQQLMEYDVEYNVELEWTFNQVPMNYGTENL